MIRNIRPYAQRPFANLSYQLPGRLLSERRRPTQKSPTRKGHHMKISTEPITFSTQIVRGCLSIYKTAMYDFSSDSYTKYRYFSTQKIRYNSRNVNIISNAESKSLFLVGQRNKHPKKDILAMVSGHIPYDKKFVNDSCQRLKKYVNSDKSVCDFISDTLYTYNRLSFGYIEISAGTAIKHSPAYKGSPHWQSQLNLATMQNFNVKPPKVKVVIFGLNVGIVFKNKSITILEGDKKSFLGDRIRKNSVEMTNATFNFENPDLILIGNYEIFSKLSADNIMEAMKRFYADRNFNVPEYLYDIHGGKEASIGSIN